jgi:TRAP-type mannitol/chloroaromatic compound transport system substrate-binding protein
MSAHLPTRRSFLATGAAVLAAPAIARAQGAPRRLRLVTSWARNFPGPGVSARRLAERINTLAAGALQIDVFAAGEIVPAFQVFDAVSQGSVDVAHTASIFWGGKMPAAPLMTTQPFGFGPTEHTAWLAGEGQALWDELYAPFGVRAFVAGNTGPSAAGWFRREITSLADLRGLRIRATGLGGEVLSGLGATALAIPPADTYAALERGVIDAVELLAPANDLPLGLARIAPFYVFPGFNKPNGPSELLINAKLWAELSPALQTMIETAARAEHDLALGEAFAANAKALQDIQAARVKVLRLPTDALTPARTAADTVLDRIAATSDIARRIVTSQRTALAQGAPWRALAGV